jgi:hypothetical protein
VRPRSLHPSFAARAKCADASLGVLVYHDSCALPAHSKGDLPFARITFDQNVKWLRELMLAATGENGDCPAGEHVHQLKMREDTGQRLRFYSALGLVTAATPMLQIIETRIIFVVSWYHLAFFVISIAMFGLTAGAVFVYLRKASFRPERLSYDLAVAALAFALATDLAILV